MTTPSNSPSSVAPRAPSLDVVPPSLLCLARPRLPRRKVKSWDALNHEAARILRAWRPPSHVHDCAHSVGVRDSGQLEGTLSDNGRRRERSPTRNAGVASLVRRPSRCGAYTGHASGLRTRKTAHFGHQSFLHLLLGVRSVTADAPSCCPRREKDRRRRDAGVERPFSRMPAVPSWTATPYGAHPRSGRCRPRARQGTAGAHAVRCGR